MVFMDRGRSPAGAESVIVTGGAVSFIAETALRRGGRFFRGGFLLLSSASGGKCLEELP